MPSPHPIRPADIDTRAFVLRVRHATAEQSARSVVDLEDVRTTETWRFTSLEAAFAQIRRAVTRPGEPSGSPAKPH